MRRVLYPWMVCVALALVATLTLEWVRPTAAYSEELWYVTTSGDDDNNCRSPVTPCGTVNGVLDKPEFEAGDTILVASGTYTKTDGPSVVLDQSAMVSGAWNATFTAQDGGPTVFLSIQPYNAVLVSGNVTATLSRVEITSRNDPTNSTPSDYGLRNHGNLMLDQVRVARNHAYGIGNGGTLTLTHSVVERNRTGGIVNAGTLFMSESVIGPNYSRVWCVGVMNENTVTLVNSTLYDNQALDGGPGGGMCNYGNATFINSTVSHNAALYPAGAEADYGGGGIYNTGSLSLYNTTVTANIGLSGGGIRSVGGQVSLYNSIIAGNQLTYSFASEGPDCQGIITSQGYNLLGDSIGCDWQMAQGDLISVTAGLAPGLRGSPPYHPLFLGSPAINAGNPAGCKGPDGEPLLTDQRGVARVGRCDIGAYEYDPAHDPLSHSFLPLLQRP